MCCKVSFINLRKTAYVWKSHLCIASLSLMELVSHVFCEINFRSRSKTWLSRKSSRSCSKLTSHLQFLTELSQDKERKCDNLAAESSLLVPHGEERSWHSLKHKHTRERVCVCVCVRERERKQFPFFFISVVLASNRATVVAPELDFHHCYIISSTWVVAIRTIVAMPRHNCLSRRMTVKIPLSDEENALLVNIYQLMPQILANKFICSVWNAQSFCSFLFYRALKMKHKDRPRANSAPSVAALSTRGFCPGQIHHPLALPNGSMKPLPNGFVVARLPLGRPSGSHLSVSGTRRLYQRRATLSQALSISQEQKENIELRSAGWFLIHTETSQPWAKQEGLVELCYPPKKNWKLKTFLTTTSKSRK